MNEVISNDDIFKSSEFVKVCSNKLNNCWFLSLKGTMCEMIVNKAIV